MSLLSGRPRRALATAFVAAAALVGVSPSADAAKLTLTYQCTYPLIGEAPLSISIDAALPTSVGPITEQYAVSAIATASGKTYDGLSLVGATKITGGATATAAVAGPGSLSQQVVVPVKIEPYTVPSTKQDLVLTASGSAPSLSFTGTGEAKVSIAALSLSLKATKADGTAVIFPGSGEDSDQDMDTFDVPCRLDPATQSTTLASIQVGLGPYKADIKFTEVTSSAATMTWTWANGASPDWSYAVRVSRADGTGEPTYAYLGPKTNSYRITGLQRDTAYRVYLGGQLRSDGTMPYGQLELGTVDLRTAAVASTTPGPGTTPITGCFPAPSRTVAPSQPFTGVTDVTGTSARISWYLQGCPTLVEYRIAVKVDEAGGERVFRTLPADLHQLQLVGLATDTPYLLTARAAYRDQTGAVVLEGTPKQVSFTTGSNPQSGPDPAPPGSITPPVPSVSHILGTSVRLHISAATAGDAPRSLKVSFLTGGTSTGGTFEFAPDGDGLSRTFNDLRPNTTYTYTVADATAAGPTAAPPLLVGTFTTTSKLPPQTSPQTGTTPTTPPLTTPPPTPTPAFSVAGTATIKTLVRGSVPLKGSLVATGPFSSGSFAADLTLAPTSAKLVALGLLPVTAKIAFVPAGPVSGRLVGGVLSASAVVRVKLPSVSLFGLQLAGGADCQTKQPSQVALKSKSGFSVTAGGALAGTFAISDLTGCGALNGLVSSLTAGKNNAIALQLTPAQR